MDKQEAITKFEQWINQRPGLYYANYDRNSLKQEYRHIANQKKRALTALSIFSRLPYDEITLRNSFKHAFSGRLSLDENDNLDYCEGQYWPTEYRLAAAVVLEEYIHSISRQSKETAVEALKMLVPSAYHWNVDRFISRCEEIALEYAPKLDAVDSIEDVTEWSKKREKVLDAIEARIHKLGLKGDFPVIIFYSYLSSFRGKGKE